MRNFVVLAQMLQPYVGHVPKIWVTEAPPLGWGNSRWNNSTQFGYQATFSHSRSTV